MPSYSLEVRFNDIVAKLAKSSHGSAALAEVKKFLGEALTSTARRASFILPKLLQQAVIWQDVKDFVWQNEDIREKNKFPFLQGDVINTRMVLRLGDAEASQEHSNWLVLSPDCDCVRSRFIRVAPVLPVYNDSKAKQIFGYSLKLSTLKAFPLPKLPYDADKELRGHFADFEEPFYIKRESVKLATPYASMTVTGWHILNAIIQEKETRAVDIEKAVTIRSSSNV